MGQVIAIKEATRVASGDSVLVFIDECYARLNAVPGFIMRPGQKDLSYAMCKAMVAGEPLAAEAPTGTGKTLAYLIGAIAAAEKLRTTKDIPIVVATATVGLQSQILTGDLPRLVQAGILGENDAVLAKGRGRYFCIESAERLTSGGEGTPQVDFFDEEGNKAAESLTDIHELLAQWRGHAWTGDRDSYTKAVGAASWARVGASSSTCLGHKCDHYNTCPFFNARRALSSAKIIIANHDLVLSDLAMARDGIDPLFSGGRYLVVFDEAHHLPDKALEAGSASFEIEPLLLELPKMLGFSRAWQRHVDLSKLFEKQKLYASDFDPSPLTNALETVQEEAKYIDVEEETLQARFERGEVPESLAKALNLAAGHSASLLKAIQDAGQALRQSNLADKHAALKPVMADLLYQLAGMNSILSGLNKALTLLTGATRAVRWLFKSEELTSLHSSPLEGAEVLRDLLWGNERAIVGMVSATLQDFDGFDRFKDRSGAPDSLRTMALPHIFPYRENTLYLVEMQHSPRQEEKIGYLNELNASMPGFIDPEEGTLILFPSRSMMKAVVPTLRKHFGGRVLCQGDLGVKELIKEHKTRIAANRGSILCGLATLAEGLDLPGDQCTHVIICALPFTVPTSPVEQELQEMLGREYFAKRAMPDALVKLVQMVGRLMRRETDRGRITVFDKRLLFTKWGLKMLGAIPAFKRQRVYPECPPPRIVRSSSV